MLLKEKGEVALKREQLSSNMNKYFINITKSLSLKEDQGISLVTLEDILENFIFLKKVIVPMKTIYMTLVLICLWFWLSFKTVWRKLDDSKFW